jgi:hypothetical protein
MPIETHHKSEKLGHQSASTPCGRGVLLGCANDDSLFLQARRVRTPKAMGAATRRLRLLELLRDEFV